MMTGLPWPWPWGDLFGGPAQYGAILGGLLLMLIGVLCLPYGLLGGAAGPLRVVTRIVPVGLVSGLAGGLMLGLALGLAGGLALALAPLHVGRLIPPSDLPIGLALGIGCGIVFGWVGGWAYNLPRGLLAGAAAGLVVGLVAFQLFFGPTAAFGPETDVGVGTEVGLAFGLLGGLAGGLFGVLLGRRPVVQSLPPGAPAGRNWLAVGLAAGAIGALTIGTVGWLTGVFALMLPYYGGFTDCSFSGSCAPQPSPLTLQVLGVVYGLGVFTLGGALIGGLAGALALPTPGRSAPVASAPAANAPAPHWASLTFGLVAGLAAGVATALQHQLIGGPGLLPGSNVPVWNPLVGGIGLAAGLAGGLALGVVSALLFAHVARQPGRRIIVVGAILIVLGLVAWTLPNWFTPLIAIDIP
ncbi:MAG TPA: hypothetical protein VGN32_20035 [Ktedonobacterales bacterium]|nr:hypothetical protein [Ktedonobacterales bacterium]